MQLEDMEQTKEVAQIKNQIKEALYQKLKENMVEFTAIGRVICYDELQEELEKTIEFLDIYKGEK